MCGISINKGLDNSLADNSKHRGIYTSSVTVEEDITLTHHTLPIQVTDSDAQSDLRQPVRLEEGYLLFNGELFNGYDKDKFDSDTAYLKNLFFECHNRGQVIQKLTTNAILWEGFWALVIYTAQDGAFTAYTDPLGKKPLYFNTQEFNIASEIKSVATSTKLDMKHLGDVRKFGYNNDDRTIYSSVRRIQQGMIYMFAAGDPAPLRLNGPQGIIVESGRNMGLGESLRQAVNDRIETIADAKVACLLSGGLDSSIVAALLIERGLDVDFYTIENEDDAQYVVDFENHFNIKVERLKYNQDDVLQNDDLFREIYLDTNESPIDLGSVVPQYYLMKTIAAAGDYRVVFTGDGADELFGGYSRIHDYDSQGSDVFSELPYYHLPRLDKSSMRFTLELRNPFLSHAVINTALALPLAARTDKKILKDTFGHLLPKSILARKKVALKNPDIRKDKIAYRNSVLEKFIELF